MDDIEGTCPDAGRTVARVYERTAPAKSTESKPGLRASPNPSVEIAIVSGP
jgi:hypothetical protein